MQPNAVKCAIFIWSPHKQKKACLKNILILQAQHEKSEIKNLIQQKFYKKKRLAVREWEIQKTWMSEEKENKKLRKSKSFFFSCGLSLNVIRREVKFVKRL